MTPNTPDYSLPRTLLLLIILLGLPLLMCTATSPANPTPLPGGEESAEASAGDNPEAAATGAVAGAVQAEVTGPAVPAFPGAEGFGAAAVGGRGGRVIEVTTLEDSGPGSLREAIEAEGPRLIVFRLAGTILLETGLTITEPYVTIAGQTAPGGGIQLRNDRDNTEPPLRIDTHDVIIRYLRVRPGPSRESTVNLDALQISGGYNIIIDHASFSWATDEVVSTWRDPHDITIQWSIIAEGLNDSTHAEGPHSKGMLIGSVGVDRVSIHHNLLAHNRDRNPRVQGGFVEFVNNVIYNAGIAARFDDEWSLEPARCNYIGNYHKPGRDSAWAYELELDAFSGAGLACYVAGNIGPHRLHDGQSDEEVVHPDGRKYLTDSPHLAWPITTLSAYDAFGLVLSEAGATLPQRDDVDKRLVRDVIYGTGRIIDDPDDVGGWPDLENASAPADSDHDGMPDAWEKIHGFDPDDPADGPRDADGDGYTNVEEFLNRTNPQG